MFAALGKFVTRYWAVVLAAWTVALVALRLVAPSTSSVRSQDDSAFLPKDSPSRVAVQTIKKHFDKRPMSYAAVVVERPTGLTGSPPTATQPAESGTDWDYIVRLTDLLRDHASQATPSWTVMSPGDPGQEFLRSILISDDKAGPAHQAAVINIDLPSSFAAQASFQAVDWIEQAAARAVVPPGLNVAVTGSACYGRDSDRAAQESLHRTTLVCIIAVVVVLLITFRALAAAAISLVTVSAAVAAALSIVAVGGAHGWSVNLLVEVFTIVVGYGAGVDFSLFFLSRYHEELGQGNGSDARAGRRAALVRALAGTGPAILASAATVAAGLSLMYFAKFRVFHTAGPAVAISIVLACLASLTLTPALAHLVGRRTFWPRRVGRRGTGLGGQSGGLWDRVASLTVSRRVPVLVLGLIVLVPLACLGWRGQKVYDTLSDLPRTASSVRGAEMFQRHFPVGQMAPVQVMVELTGRTLTEAQWATVALKVDDRLKEELGKLSRTGPAGQPADRSDVRSLVHPLGLGPKGIEIAPQQVSMLISVRPPPPWAAWVLDRLLGIGQKELEEKRRQFRTEVLPRHVDSARKAGLWEVALPWPPYSNQALDSLDGLKKAAQEAAEEAAKGIPRAAVTPADQPPRPAIRVLLAGDTAMMADLRDVTDRDFWFVGALAVATIIAIVTLLTGDLPVAMFVMLATILSYGAALALTNWAFHVIFGTAGLDWKVNFSLFVILVAVGQDYNLFMLTRIMEERRALPLGQAVQAAVARTGSIISYCGLIMAATLGSLASSPLRLLQELGTAFIIGLLIDTFLVRPLMVPAFIVVFKRMGGRAKPGA